MTQLQVSQEILCFVQYPAREKIVLQASFFKYANHYVKLYATKPTSHRVLGHQGVGLQACSLQDRT